MVTKVCNPIQKEFGYRPQGLNLSPFACEAVVYELPGPQNLAGLHCTFLFSLKATI